MSGGWNPVTGRDPSGVRPPMAPFGAPTPGQGQPYIPRPGFSGPGYGFGNFSPLGNWYNMTYGYNLPGQMQQQPPHVIQGSSAAPLQAGAYYYPFSHQPNGANNIYTRQPHPWPAVDGNMPAAHMTNSSGGVGCEPGYNYFFPPEHTKVHVFRSNTPPWHLPAGAQIQFKAAHIPVSVTLGELLKGFGCDNPSPKKNQCYEIIPGGNGTWYKGVNYSGKDKDMLKMTMKDVGWDMSRSGHPSEKPVVCLWFCKD